MNLAGYNLEKKKNPVFLVPNVTDRLNRTQLSLFSSSDSLLARSYRLTANPTSIQVSFKTRAIFYSFNGAKRICLMERLAKPFQFH